MRVRNTLILFGLPALVLLGGCRPQDDCVRLNEGMRSMHQEGITLLDDNGKSRHVQALVADDETERSFGFQHVCPDVIEDTTILFVYPRPVTASFHMSNVNAPLDIAFFDGQGQLISVLRMDIYTDEGRPLYSPGRSFQYALEARPGFFQDSALSPGRSRLIPDSL